MRIWATRALTVSALVAMAVGIAVTPALAHVTVNPSEAEPGAFTVLSFRVPTERDNASTVEFAVSFPSDQPLRSVFVRPHPGWSYEVTRAPLPTPVESGEGQITEAVSVITWRAAPDAEIKPGEYDEFAVSVGPLPEVDQLVFPAVQTYSNAEVVRWIEQPADGGEEPEFPAPVLRLGTEGSTVDTAPASPVAVDGDPEESSASTDSAARLLASIALVVGVVAGLLAGPALIRGRGRSAAN